jgi:Uma2 family endonuclease
MLSAQEPITYETERGKPTPSANHAVVQAYLTAAFLRFDDKYSILPELSLELGGVPSVPDISVYPKLDLDLRHDRIKMTEPPLLTVEILSPTQSLDDLIRKAYDYLEAGVPSCWVVQPILQSIVVLSPGEKPAIYSSGDVTDAGTGITVNVEEIFRSFH